MLLKRLSFTQDTLEPGVCRRLCAPVTLYSELVNTLFGVYNTLDKLFNYNLQWTEIPFYKFLCYEVNTKIKANDISLKGINCLMFQSNIK